MGWKTATKVVQVVENSLPEGPCFSHDFSDLEKGLWFAYAFSAAATVDAIFEPWLWADVKKAGERQLFPLVSTVL